MESDFDCELDMTFNELDRVLEDGLGNEDSADLEQAMESMYRLAKRLNRPVICKFIVNPPIKALEEDEG